MARSPRPIRSQTRPKGVAIELTGRDHHQAVLVLRKRLLKSRLKLTTPVVKVRDGPARNLLVADGPAQNLLVADDLRQELLEIVRRSSTSHLTAAEEDVRHQGRHRHLVDSEGNLQSARDVSAQVPHRQDMLRDADLHRLDVNRPFTDAETSARHQGANQEERRRQEEGVLLVKTGRRRHLLNR